MINYYTHVDVNDAFNQDILLEMFFEWLNTTRNKMEGLDYKNEESFVYIEGKNKSK